MGRSKHIRTCLTPTLSDYDSVLTQSAATPQRAGDIFVREGPPSGMVAVCQVACTLHAIHRIKDSSSPTHSHLHHHTGLQISSAKYQLALGYIPCGLCFLRRHYLTANSISQSHSTRLDYRPLGQGVNIALENPSWILGTFVRPSNNSTSSWVHFAIPTSVILSNIHVRAGQALVHFSTGPRPASGPTTCMMARERLLNKLGWT